MKVTLVTSFVFFGFFCCFSLYGQDAVKTYDPFREGFQSPPSSALPKVYWWWLNGNVNPARLKTELTDMKKAGITGVDIFDIGGPEVPNPGGMIPAGPAFMGEKSLQYIKIDEII